MGGNDIEEMFLNFLMQKSPRKVCTVNVMQIGSDNPTLPDLESQKCSKWKCRCRDMMGTRPPPYISIEHLIWGKECIMGDKDKENNPFSCHNVRLNLP